MLAAVGLLIPTVFHDAAAMHPGGWSIVTEQRLSLAIAIVLFASYLFTLVFSLLTHKQLFVGAGADGDDHHEPVWSRTKATMVLIIATAFVAWFSEFLVGTVEAAQAKLGVSETFIAVS